MVLPIDRSAEVRRRTARIAAAVGDLADLPNGPEHVAELLRLLAHPQIERLVAQAEHSHREHARAAGHIYLRCFAEILAADPSSPARSARLREPEGCDDSCVLIIEVPGLPADGDPAAQECWALNFQSFETRIHDRVQASNETALGQVLVEFERAVSGAA